MEKFTSSYRVRSASNIALIKYWGKFGEQLPCNPSLSVTLSNCFTEASFLVSRENPGALDFTLEGKKKEGFDSKAIKLHKRIAKDYPSLLEYSFKIDSRNTFPHGAGIASSASALSCLAKGFLHALAINDPKIVGSYSRIGSGSACRSVLDGLSLWGQTKFIKESSDEYAVPVKKVDPIFLGLLDSIVVVSDEEKEVSSSAGHALMETHPYAKRRFEVARENLEKLLISLEVGDWSSFIEVVEREALELHSMMMTGIPSYTLMKPATLDFIINFRKWRAKSHARAAFTLDAGPNIHVIHSPDDYELVDSFINEWMKKQGTGVSLIKDHAGMGSQILDWDGARE